MLLTCTFSSYTTWAGSGGIIQGYVPFQTSLSTVGIALTQWKCYSIAECPMTMNQLVSLGPGGEYYRVIDCRVVLMQG